MMTYIDRGHDDMVKLDMDNKKCTKCGKLLPLSSFHRKNKNTLRSACKCCTNKKNKEYYLINKETRTKKMREHYENNKEQYQKSHARYRQTEKGKEVLRKAKIKYLNTPYGRKNIILSVKKWSEKNRIKRRTHWNVKQAVRDGRLIKQPCQICGASSKLSHAHHEDYTKPLQVNWYCPAHHKMLHRNQRYYE